MLNYKLGKLPPKVNRKTLLFSDYLKATAPPAPPEKLGWEYKVPTWGMMKNDSVGCCTCSAYGHMVMNWTAHTSSIVIPSDEQVIAMYSAVTGYVPGNESTDNGAAITDILQYGQKKGMDGHKIVGWAAVDTTNIEHIKQAIEIFGALDIGVNLPANAMDQFNAEEDWHIDPENNGIEGGHCIPLMGYGSVGAACITWGRIQYMHWDWFSRYCDEAYAAISAEWLAANGMAPNSLDMAALQSDLQAIAA